MASSGEKFLYFLIGGFVGASVALLFAPKSGEETRGYLEGKYRQGSEEMARRIRSGRETVHDVKETVSDKIANSLSKGKEAVNRQTGQISSAIEAGKRAYQEEKGKLEGQASSEL